MTLAVVGGSGLYELTGLERIAEHTPETPWGKPSDAILEGRLGERRVLFLPRHGRGHRLLPSEIPYRANIAALKALGAQKLLSVSAVGSLREDLPPGALVFPDQFIDRAVHRPATFFGDGIVGHVSLADPTCDSLRRLAASEATRLDGQPACSGGTYLCMEGPAFSTRAESRLYRSWGCDVIGMTNATEAKLAREAGLCYATACFVTDYDCWKTDEAPVTLEQVLAVMQANVERGRALVAAVIAAADPSSCRCGRAAAEAVVTAPDQRDAARVRALSGVLGGFGGAL